MKTFAINLHFITGTIERFVVTLVSLRKHVVGTFCMVRQAAKKERNRSMSLFNGLAFFICNAYLCIHHFNFNEAASWMLFISAPPPQALSGCDYG